MIDINKIKKFNFIYDKENFSLIFFFFLGDIIIFINLNLSSNFLTIMVKKYIYLWIDITTAINDMLDINKWLIPNSNINPVFNVDLNHFSKFHITQFYGIFKKYFFDFLSKNFIHLKSKKISIIKEIISTADKIDWIDLYNYLYDKPHLYIWNYDHIDSFIDEVNNYKQLEKDNKKIKNNKRHPILNWL